mmetsp:Transcript_19500/g.33523  ORF Transcript_19500/g.33523 Transcript_19500/m.33523 type:complete len:188 (+) Transcript_19500:58-621(+)
MDFIIASITSTAIVGIAAGSGYLQERFNVEQQLFDALPVKLQDASILLALIVVLLNWLGYYLSTGVGTARSKFNVGAPVCYPTEKELPNPKDREKFVSIIRTQENFLETNSQLIFSILISWFLVKNYATLTLLTVILILARVWYTEAYKADLKSRGWPFRLATCAMVFINGPLAWIVAKALFSDYIQ